jgi:twitching motility protein PilU
VGLDTKSYARALRSAMRAAPDVLLIGEIRDRETMESAIMLSGTGHLVLATLHANNGAETMDRIINMFPRDQHTQLCLDLSQYLRAIIAQRLIPGKNKRRVAAVEMMINSPHMQELIKKGDVIASASPAPAAKKACTSIPRCTSCTKMAVSPSKTRSITLIQEPIWKLLVDVLPPEGEGWQGALFILKRDT